MKSLYAPPKRRALHRIHHEPKYPMKLQKRTRVVGGQRKMGNSHKGQLLHSMILSSAGGANHSAGSPQNPAYGTMIRRYA